MWRHSTTECQRSWEGRERRRARGRWRNRAEWREELFSVTHGTLEKLHYGRENYYGPLDV